MKRIGMCAALGLCAVLLAACGLAGGSSSAVGSAGGNTDPLTGEISGWPGRRVAAVVIDNAPDTASQWGLSEASVVIEALTSAGQPSSLCLAYPSVEAMPCVGPVAAGQDLFWRLLAAQQVLPVQRGCGRYTDNYLDFYGLRAVDAREVGRKAFSCAREWSNAPPWVTSGTAVSGVLGELNLSGQLSRVGANARVEQDADGREQITVPALLPFQEGGRRAAASAEDAVQVQLCFNASSSTGFVYDPDSRTYRMLRGDGTPWVDANSGTQAAFDNLLVLYSTSYPRDDGVTLDYDLSMGGGVWLNGGQLWNVTWRQGTETTFALYDAGGKALSIQPGRSYLALVSSVTGQELTVLNTAGENLLLSP